MLFIFNLFLRYEEQWFHGSISQVRNSHVQNFLLQLICSSQNDFCQKFTFNFQHKAKDSLMHVDSAVGDFLITQNATKPSDFSIAVKTGLKSIKSAPSKVINLLSCLESI